MVLILDGNSEYVARTYLQQIVLKKLLLTCEFISEIPFDKVFELSLLKFEPTSFDQVFEVFHVNDIGLLMLYSVKKSIQKHVILLLVGELIIVLDLERLHQLAKLVLVKITCTSRVFFHNFFERC